MRAALLVIATLTLASCRTPVEPGVEIRTVEVPVPVPCIARNQIPDEPERVGEKLTGFAAADLQIVSSSALKLREWGQTLHSALVACSG